MALNETANEWNVNNITAVPFNKISHPLSNIAIKEQIRLKKE
jgi:hypothetical protein